MRRGVTLPELLVVVVLLGAVAALAVPALAPALDRLAVERWAQEVAAAHGRARIVAVTASRKALLTISDDSLVLRLAQAPDTPVVWRRRGPLPSDGVSLRGPGHEVAFTPIGITMGVANATYVLQRGAAARRVVVSRLGRVRVLPGP